MPATPMGMPEATLLELFRRRVAETPSGEASRHTYGRKVVTTTWSDWDRRSRTLAAGLLRLGVELGDRVALLSRTRVEWTWLDMAILMAGGVTVPLFPSETGATCAFVLADCEARFAIVENPAQVRKLLALREQLPRLERVVVLDQECELPQQPQAPDAVLRLADVADEASAGWLVPIEELWDGGERDLGALTGELATRAALVGPDTLATLAYTPGTEREPKGVMLTHGNYFAASDALAQALSVGPEDRQLLYLPLAHVFARITVVVAMQVGLSTAYARSYGTLLDDARLHQPTFLCTIPRLLEKVQGEMEADERMGGGLQRLVSTWARGVGATASQNGDGGGLLRDLQLKVADKLVFSRLRERFGGALRFVISGAAPLPHETGRFFAAHGLPALEGYGMTETCAATSIARLERHRVGTVGPPLPGVEVRLTEDGELLVRGPNVSPGYWERPDETAAAIDADGWFHTGDLCRLEDDEIVVMDRKSDIILLATGRAIAPQPIAEALRAHDLVSQVLIHGEGRSFLSALITLDKDALLRFADEASLDPDYEGLTRHPAVFAAVERLVERVNAQLAPHENIRKFAILSTEPSTETGDLTPTQRLRRRVATERHRALLDSFYSEQY